MPRSSLMFSHQNTVRALFSRILTQIS
jgi:hypothetical protein